MSEIVARCGFRCDLCLIYQENLKKDPQNRQRFRDALEKYYGDKLTLEQCYCDGCMVDDSENPVLITTNCKIRPCVIARGIENCACCDIYPCPDVEKKFFSRRRVEEIYGAPIPDDAYKLFVMPYEAKRVLGKIRQKRKR
jgi:hypothetical protein